MSGFFRRFLREDARALNVPAGRHIFFAAFGKHPGWDDHIPDLGLETDSLLTAKTLLYVDGIGGQINAGAWEKLEPAQRLDAFDHWWLWARADQFILGRLWSSVDGKGRTLFPMVVCAHCLGCSLPWGLAHVLPKLEEVRARVITTQAASDVTAILEEARADLRSQAAQLDGAEASVKGADHGRFLDAPDWNSDHEGLLRILHKIRSELRAYAVGARFVDAETTLMPPTKSAGARQPGLRPQSIRVPAGGDSVAEVFLQWRDFFRTQVDPGAPILFTLPQTLKWVDALIGKPTSQELFALRASLNVLPLASAVPYTLDEKFRESAKQFILHYRDRPAVESSSSGKLLRVGLTFLSLLLLLALFAAFLRYAPEQNIPSFLQTPARLIGNPEVPASSR